MSRPIEGLPLQPGDIAATRGTGPLGWLSKNLLDPETDRYHHMIIGGWVRSQQDWVVYESIGKGVAIGYLGALYTGQELEVYRLSTRNAQEIGEDVVDILPYYGRAHYDYLLPMKLAVGALECFVKQITGERTLRRIRPEELPYVRDSRFICTELAIDPFQELGMYIVPKHVAPLPATIKQAVCDGKLNLVWKGIV